MSTADLIAELDAIAAASTMETAWQRKLLARADQRDREGQTRKAANLRQSVRDDIDTHFMPCIRRTQNA